MGAISPMRRGDDRVLRVKWEPELEEERRDIMKECKECELAVYCYSEPGTWVFRTKEEMEEKRTAILDCPVYRKNLQHRSCTDQCRSTVQNGRGH